MDVPPRFDIHDPAVVDDPYPAYARLREAGPLCRGGPAQWVVTRYADVAALLTDQRLGNALPPAYHRLSAGDGPAGEFVQRLVLYRDRPDHTRLRRLMAHGFTPGVVRGLRSRIAELVDGLLAPACDLRALEVVDDLAFPLPVMVICELIGIPVDDRDAVRPRAFDLGRALATSGSPEHRAAADGAVTWLRDYIGGLLRIRRTAPRDDLLSLMLAAEEGGERLSHEEIVDNVVFLFFAGFETTTSMIATGCAALLDHPAQLVRLRASPALAGSAVEEFLRYDAPIQSRVRLVLEHVKIGDRTIRPGRIMLLLLGSANHDERRFSEPSSLDVGREPNPHLSFGGGGHYCLGAALARLEGSVVFDRLVTRFAAFEAAGTAVREPGSAFRTYSRIPVAVRPS